MMTMKNREALKSAEVGETLTISRPNNAGVIGTATASYRFDTVAANAPHTNCDTDPYAREWNGPQGRWYSAGKATYFDWDANHAYPAVVASSDTAAPVLQSVTVPATTTTRTITIGLSATDNVRVTEVRFANEDGNWSAWRPFGMTKQWTLSSNLSSLKGVSSQVRDAAHNESSSI